MSDIQMKVLTRTARSVTIELDDGGIYDAHSTYEIWLNGEWHKTTDKVITSVFGLEPDTDYEIEARLEDAVVASCEFATEPEFVTLNIKEFGAKGDGQTDDTLFIQAAILSCPEGGRVLVPEGTYLITTLFLKSNLRLEIAKDAKLIGNPDREIHPILPDKITSNDGLSEYDLGTWEGDPQPAFSGIITGINCENVVIYGEGTIDGGAGIDNWWFEPKKMRIAWRPRLVFLSHCKNVVMQGLACQNSPSWNLHPYFSQNLGFYNLEVLNPWDSPNTDGLDPESCKDVEIAGMHFSLGDDCIAVKSGKLYMGQRYKTPSENVHIFQCKMESGHGAVTLGSEIAGGIRNMTVEKCIFSHTDRGLRIKTRRGRGKYCRLDEITFRDIKMDHVMTPFTANAFYFCDPDGKTDYVQTRELVPVDDRTPELGRFLFENIEAKNCHVAAAWFEGLPESKIIEVIMKNVSISYADEPTAGVPIMSNGVDECSKRGIFVRNAKRLVFENVSIQGQVGDKLEVEGVEEIDGDIC